MKTPELKPCPFCGGEAYVSKTDFGFYFVGCLTERCYGSLRRMAPISQNFELISELWNRRAIDENRHA